MIFWQYHDKQCFLIKILLQLFIIQNQYNVLAYKVQWYPSYKATPKAQKKGWPLVRGTKWYKYTTCTVDSRKAAPLLRGCPLVKGALQKYCVSLIKTDLICTTSIDANQNILPGLQFWPYACNN